MQRLINKVLSILLMLFIFIGSIGISFHYKSCQLGSSWSIFEEDTCTLTKEQANCGENCPFATHLKYKKPVQTKRSYVYKLKINSTQALNQLQPQLSALVCKSNFISFQLSKEEVVKLSLNNSYPAWAMHPPWTRKPILSKIQVYLI